MDRRLIGLTVLASGLLLAVSLWSMRDLLGPVFSTAALAYLLWPHRRNEAIRRLLIVSVVLLTIWILAEARAIVYPALAALALAFLLDPAVSRLSERGVRRGLAALALMLPLLALLALFVLVAVPALFAQADRLFQQLPPALAKAYAWLTSLVEPWLRARGIQVMPPDLNSMLPASERILRGLVSGAGSVGRGLMAAVEVAAFALLTPILTYYILVDFTRLRASLRTHLPAVWVERLGRFGGQFQQSVGAWLKGQLLVALLVAALSTGGFLLIRLPYALLLGALAGLLNLVPVLGYWITVLLALGVALFEPHPLALLLKAAGVLVAVQLIEQNLLSPRIVGKQLGVKPVILLLTMLALSVFLGLLGVLLAAPVIGLARGLWAVWSPRAAAAPGREPPAAAATAR